MNEYAQGFNISSEEIAVFVSVARKAADMMNISISELFGKLESYARAMEDIMEAIAALEISPPPSKLERLWRAQRRRAERERMRVFLKYLEFLFVIRKYKPP